MENVMYCHEQKSLINMELTQGKELANQLKNQFDQNEQDSGEICEVLVAKILSSYEKALSLLKSSALVVEENLPLESPHSFTSDESPKSEISNQSHKKKRKALPQWSEQVEVSLETGNEDLLEDGYSWRKYGQKDILGATYPRAYYRCTHRHTQGCLATKQVQKSDKNPSKFEITYRGRHTCNQNSRHLASQVKKHKKQQKQEEQKDIVLNFGTSEILHAQVERMPSFAFPSTLIEFENVENCSFLMSQCSQTNNFGVGQNLHNSESDLPQIWSAPNSITNSPIGALDFPLDPIDFDPNFPCDILEFFH